MASNRQVNYKTKLHYDLISKLMDIIYVEWNGYDKLLVKLMGYGLTKQEKYISQQKNDKLFEYLGDKGLIKVGNYDILLEVLEGLNEPARKLIQEYKAEIDALSGEKEDTGKKRRHVKDNPQPSCSNEHDDPQPSCSTVQKCEQLNKATNTKALRVRSKAEERTLAKMDRQMNSNIFVPTLAVVKGKQLLEQNRILIYIGLAGDGKTENALYIMNQCRKENPEALYIKVDSVSECRDVVDPNVESVIFLEDCLGKTNANKSAVNDDNIWNDIEDYIDKGKVRLILTIRKHIFMRYCTKLQNNGTRLFMKKNVIDLETQEFVLTYKNKRDILARHCKNNNIEICDKIWNEIISKECVVGFPYTCYLFCCHPKYTKQGAKFFEKPLEVLKENISELANSESKLIEKIQYCLMCYMVIKGGKIDLENVDQEIFEQIIKSLQIESPSESEKLEAINELNHRYILGKKPLFSFKHQTILECVALCFKNNNISLLLQFCSKDFISEFVRPANYEDIEGEEIIKLNRNDYEHVIQRFVKFLLEEEIYRFPRGWNHSVHFYVQYPLLEDKEFIDLFINVIKSKKLDQNIEFTSRLFAVASQYGNHFINRVYNDLQVDTDSVDTGFCLVKAIFAGYTDTVVWLLDHNLGLDKVIEVLGIANTDTMTAIVNHHNITFNHVKKVIMERNIHCDKIVNVMINRWPDMDQKYVLELLDVCLRSDFEKAFGAIITSRQDFATHQVISQCLRGACFIGSIKVVEFIVSKQLCTLTQHIMKEIFTLACAAGQIEIFNYLLDLKITGIDLTPIYTTDNDKNITNLHVAACFGRYEVVGKLIKLGLDVNGKSDFGKSVMTYAIIGYKYRNTSEEFGKSHWFKQTRMEFPSLSPFIEKEDLYPGNLYDYNQVLNCLIPVISDINLADLDMVLDKQGGTLAHYCVKNNEKQTIELLKNRYIKAIFSKTSEKQTCLHIAAIFGRFDIFKMLVGVNKASLSIIDRDNSGRSVLQYAMIGFKFFGRETCCFEHDFDRNFDWMDRLYFQSVFDKISDDSESDRISDDSESDRISDDSESDSFIIDFKDKCNTVTIDNENDELGNAADKSNCENIYDTCIVREEDKSDYTMNESNNDSSDTIMKNDCDRGDIVMVENDNRSDNPYTSDNDRLDVLTVTNEHVMGEKLNTDKMWDIQTEHNVFQRCKGFPGFGNVSEYSEIFLNLIQNKDCDITDLDMVVNNCGCTLAHYCVVYDSRSVIKTLIDVRPSLFYLQNKNNHKPIDLAVLLGRDEIFEMLYPIQ